MDLSKEEDDIMTVKYFRSTVTKGVRDALLEKLKKSDLEIEDKKVMKIAEEIEIAMFGKYS